MSLYAYCLCEDSAAEASAGGRGVGGAEVSALRLGSLAALVSEFEGERVAVTRENVLAHSRVNARALAVTTPLPFRFGTLAEAERLAAYVAANEAGLREALARVSGHVEMGAKVLRAAAEAETRAGLAEEPGAAAGSGTAYLLAKRRAIEGGEALMREAEGAAAWLAGVVSDLARESSVSVNPAGQIVVRAAHLVERGRAAEYRARLRAAGERRPELRLLTSGPWPPYSFGPPRS